MCCSGYDRRCRLCFRPHHPLHHSWHLLGVHHQRTQASQVKRRPGAPEQRHHVSIPDAKQRRLRDQTTTGAEG